MSLKRKEKHITKDVFKGVFFIEKPTFHYSVLKRTLNCNNEKLLRYFYFIVNNDDN